MADDDLAARVARYLERQIAWFEEMIAELDAFDRIGDDAEADAWGARQERRSRELDAFAAEHRSLLAAWQRDDCATAAGRAEVRRLADRAERLRTRLLARYAASMDALGARIGAARSDFAALRRGQEMLEKYRPGAPPPHDYLDRKA